MTGGKPDHRSVMAAALTASFLTLVFGLTYRALAARLGVPVTTTTPIAPEALEGFPMQIGDWTGQDVPLDEAIVRRTGTDAHINRHYSRHNDLESVCLYLASGVKTRALVGHRPEVCYITAGWTLTGSRLMELRLNDETKLPCSVFHFSRGDLNVEKLTVLNYFIVDGQHYGNVSVLRSKMGRRLAGVGYVAQVQIVSREILTADSAMRLVCAFAVDSALSMARLFDGLAKDKSADSPHEMQEGQ